MSTSAFDMLNCPHASTAIRYRQQGNGTRYYRQCLRCGEIAGSVTKDSLPLTLHPERFDEGLRERSRQSLSQYFADSVEQRQREQAEKQQAWWDSYNAYLQTPAWQEKRRQVLQCDDYVCQGCRGRRAVHVHHLTYERVGHEMLFDLVSVCAQCHEEIHGRKI